MFLKKIFRKINALYIADEGEHIPLSDLIWFYGFFGGGILLAIVLLVVNINAYFF